MHSLLLSRRGTLAIRLPFCWQAWHFSHMASELAQRGPTWRPDRCVGSQNGTKSGPRRPSMAPKSSPEAQHGSQISPKTSNIAPKSAPKKKAWPPRWPQEAQHGTQVASKSISRAQHGSLAFVCACPRYNMVPRWPQEDQNGTANQHVSLDLHLATSTSMKLLAITPMSVPRLYASWLIRKQQNRGKIRTAHGRRSYQN